MKDKNMTRVQFVKEIEKLLHQTRACDGLVLQYGSVKTTYSDPKDSPEGKVYVLSRKFTPSERDLNQPDDPTEVVRLSWGEQSDLFASYQSIEGDSGVSIISDIMKTVMKMI